MLILTSSSNSFFKELKFNSSLYFSSKSCSRTSKNSLIERLSFFFAMNAIFFPSEVFTFLGTLKEIQSSSLSQMRLISFFFSSSSHSLRYLITLILLHFRESAISLNLILLDALRSIKWENSTACKGLISSFSVIKLR